MIGKSRIWVVKTASAKSKGKTAYDKRPSPNPCKVESLMYRDCPCFGVSVLFYKGSNPQPIMDLFYIGSQDISQKKLVSKYWDFKERFISTWINQTTFSLYNSLLTIQLAIWSHSLCFLPYIDILYSAICSNQIDHQNNVIWSIPIHYQKQTLAFHNLVHW